VLDGRNALSDARLRKVATEMALNVLAYNMKRVIAILLGLCGQRLALFCGRT